MSSQVKIHPEPIHDTAAQGGGIALPPGLLFKENDVYVPVNNHFLAAITEDGWILGKYYNNSIHPIYNQRLKIVRANLYNHDIVPLSIKQIRQMHFYQPYFGSENNAREATTSAIHQRRNSF